MRLLLNAKPYLHRTTLQTWGQWLSGLDADSQRTGQIVTEVRFNGVDEPAFRAPATRDWPLNGFDLVEVKTEPPRELVIHTLNEGSVLAGSLADAARSLGEAFRQADLQNAHTMLPDLVDGIRSVVTLTDVCAAALGVRPDMITCEGTPFDQWMNEFGRRLAVLIEAEAGQDWATVADSLEYELEPGLREWVSVFEQLSATATATAAAVPSH